MENKGAISVVAAANFSLSGYNDAVSIGMIDAIWESDGITEVAYNRYIGTYDDVSVGSLNLISGNWYYISADNYYSGYRSTFTLDNL